LPLISIVIPTLNESANLATTIAKLRANAGGFDDYEILVVDGGSGDDTVAIAQAQNATVIPTQPGRGQQLNAGAALAQGEILLFLHADTQLPKDWPAWVTQTLAQPSVVAGAFELAIAAPQLTLRWVEWGVNWRSRWGQMPYGDQGIFLTRQQFQAVGGFPDISIMEDFGLIKRLQKLGRIAIAPVSVTTSGRRWEQLGVVKTTLLNQVMILGFYCGVSPDRLRQWYRTQRH
jgi:rSAM/selenodomain-associated transferase 2